MSIETYLTKKPNSSNEFVEEKTRLLLQILTVEGYKTATFFDVYVNDLIFKEFKQFQIDFEKKSLNYASLKFLIRGTEIEFNANSVKIDANVGASPNNNNTPNKSSLNESNVTLGSGKASLCSMSSGSSPSPIPINGNLKVDKSR